MPIVEIPKSFRYICDGCGFEHLQENASGHYTDSRPPKWAKLMFARDALDYLGDAAADATIKLLLCPTCQVRVAMLLNELGTKLKRP
jgi:hypothetical protein